MMVYPRALVARHIYARTVAAWHYAEPTDKPPGYPLPPCPRLPRDLSARDLVAGTIPARQRDGTACHRAPPSRYPRALPRALADTRVPCPSRYRAGQPSAHALAIAAKPPDPLAVIGQPRTIAAEPSRQPCATVDTRQPSRRTGPTLGNPTQTEHPFDLLGRIEHLFDRTNVRRSIRQCWVR